MNALEAQLDYPFGDSLPAIGETLAIAPGLAWLRMPLPFALDHINLWLLEDGDGASAGYAAVDCGVATDATRAAWQQVFDGPMAGRPLTRVVATHCHPDHIGLSDWLCRRFGIPFWITTGEYGFGRMMSAGLPGVDGTAAIPHFEKHGLAGAALTAQLESRKNYFPSLVPAVPVAYTRMQHGQLVRIGGNDWRVITGFGHSPEHASLYCEQLNVLISGDMVLPRISTNVSVFAVEPEGNPLQLYLDSLERFTELACRHPGAALARPALPRLAHPHLPTARAPRGAPGRSAGRLCNTALCHGHRALDVQATARRPPAQFRARRSARSPASIVGARYRAAAAGRRWHHSIRGCAEQISGLGPA